ncbi:hypothetical protein OG455_27630 [Kitasatospora sp. NBC_01287]|uniref:hypothetical protein n=1 Tax=Kitasatospora sp. NBC_01287 TaxID=2903573 RepID=UPI0022535FEF|nr:hypothetical protein [Kitasatospora sp. NBC_01287]MCX4749232.1 hypothetical protein [Kitasatospora sp. NBC_01287]
MTLTPIPPEPQHVRIQASGPTARLELNGRNMADQVREYQLRHTAGQIPECLLLLKPTADVDWDGAARVLVGEDPDPGPAAAQFLAALDGGEVERAVLARHDLLDGAPHEFTRALLTQLTEWALGKRQPGEPAEVPS